MHQNKSYEYLASQIEQECPPLFVAQYGVGFVHEGGVGSERAHESCQQDHAGFGVQGQTGFQKSEDKAEKKCAQHVDEKGSQRE